MSNLSALLLLALSLAMLALQAFAFASALAQRKDAYVAADKLSKPAWTIILGLGLAIQLLFSGPLGLLNLAAVVAALVYVVDVRPAIRSLSRS